MIIYRGLGDPRLKSRPRAVAIGIFDGIHRGHAEIIRRLMRPAGRRLSPMVVTFDPHPWKVLMPKAYHPTILMSIPHRLRCFERMGIREALVIRFNKKFAKVSHQTFLSRVLLGRLGMKFLSVGEDFRFGHRALGDRAFLGRMSARLGFQVVFTAPLREGREVISSTRIRRLIEKGELEKAQKMLGRPVSVCGTVIHGRGRGRGVGFPTANLNPRHVALPPSGVYAAWGFLSGKRMKGVIHIGERPTFGDKEKSLEVHFLNFHKDVYGKEIELIFVKKLRGIKRFPDSKALEAAIARDASAALKILT